MCSFLLVAGRGTLGARPAVQALVVTGFGGLALLGAVVLLVVRTGTSDLNAVLAAAPRTCPSTDLTVVGILVMLAAFTKSAQVPFHFWLPGAMAAPTPVSAYLHAATLVKAGIYLLRLSPRVRRNGLAPDAGRRPGDQCLVGGFRALRQPDLKPLLAYATVSQLGLHGGGLAGAGRGTCGAAILVAATDCSRRPCSWWWGSSTTRRERATSAGSAACGGYAGDRRADRPGGDVDGRHPADRRVRGQGGGLLRLPEHLPGGVDRRHGGPGTIAALIAVAGAAMTFAYSARIIAGAFAGPLVQTTLYEPRAAFLAPAAIPAVLGLMLGLAPWVLNGIVDRAVLDTGFVGTGSDLALWHGLSLALGMSATALGRGIGDPHAPQPPGAARPRRGATDARAGPLRPRVVRRAGVRCHGEPRARAQWAGAHLARGPAAARAADRSGRLHPHRAGPGAGRCGAAGDWVLLAILLPAVVALSRAGDGMAALVLAGAVGLVLTVWLMVLGAPDVALTLLLVEVLTVVVAAPVLSRIPAHRARACGRRGAAVAAVLVGGLAGALVLVLTGRRERSEVAGYYLAEAERATGGSNVVNTILVDFRGLDTLGEIVVLAAAALGLLALTRDRSGAGSPRARWAPGRSRSCASGPRWSCPWSPRSARCCSGGVTRSPGVGSSPACSPAPVWRSPGCPGSTCASRRSRRWWPAGWCWPCSSRPRPGGRAPAAAGDVPLPVAGYLTTSLVFDLGVFLVVVGLVQAALDHVANRSPVEAGTAVPGRSQHEAEVTR